MPCSRNFSFVRILSNAISLVSREEQSLLRDIERLIRRPIPRLTVANYEPAAAAAHDLEHRPPRPPQAGRTRKPSQERRNAPRTEAKRQQPMSKPRNKPPAQPGTTNSRHAGRSEQHTASSTSQTAAPGGVSARARSARPNSPPKPAPAGTHAPRRDDSLVRTNIPGLAQPPHRRGR
jgi:ATP-dependent RNA helicase RhlE